MFKIQYASDLHLEFPENTRFLEKSPIQPITDVLVLAGDMGYLGSDNYVGHPFWDWASRNYEQVVVIPGNHEFYQGYDLGKLHNGWSMEIRPNVKCYYNAVIPLTNDIDLIASTLWGHIEAKDAFVIVHSPIEYWIYGHSHINIDKVIGGTRCVSNQLGYVSHGEHLFFDTAKCITIE